MVIKSLIIIFKCMIQFLDDLFYVFIDIWPVTSCELLSLLLFEHILQNVNTNSKVRALSA